MNNKNSINSNDIPFINSNDINLYLPYCPEPFPISQFFFFIGIIEDKSYLPLQLPTTPADQRGPICGITSAYNQMCCYHQFHKNDANPKFHQHHDKMITDEQKATANDHQDGRQNSNPNLERFNKNSQYKIIPQRKKTIINQKLVSQSDISMREIVKKIEIEGKRVSQAGEIYDYRLFLPLFSNLGFKGVTVSQSNPDQYITDLCTTLSNGHTVTTSVNINGHDRSPAIKGKCGYGVHWITIYGYITTKHHKIYFIISQFGKYFLFDGDNLKKSNDNLINTNIPFNYVEKSNNNWRCIDINKRNNSNECKENNPKLRKMNIDNHQKFHHSIIAVPYRVENSFKRMGLFANDIRKLRSMKFRYKVPVELMYQIYRIRKELFEFHHDIPKVKNMIINHPECINYKTYHKLPLVMYISCSREYRQEIFTDYLKANPDKKILLTPHKHPISAHKNSVSIDYMIGLNNEKINQQLIQYIENNRLTPEENRIIFLSATTYNNYDIQNFLAKCLSQDSLIKNIAYIKELITSKMCHIYSETSNQSYPDSNTNNSPYLNEIKILKKIIDCLRKELIYIEVELANQVRNNNDLNTPSYSSNIYYQFSKKPDNINELLNNVITDINKILTKNNISIVNQNNTSKPSM